MLNGIDPVIIFEFKRNVDNTFVGPVQPSILSRIPIISQFPEFIDNPPIPIYLSERQTGLMIKTEGKDVSLTTNTQSLSSGASPDVNQKALASTVSIDIEANKDSLGLALLSSLIDLVYEKASSKEYSITYLHGPIIIFRGKLEGYSIDQESNEDRAKIKIQLTKGDSKPTAEAGLPQTPRLSNIQVL